MKSVIAMSITAVVAAITLSACSGSVVDQPDPQVAAAPAFDTGAWRASWAPQVDKLTGAASTYAGQVRWLVDHNATPAQLAPAIGRLSTDVSSAATDLVAALDKAPVPAEQADLVAKAAALRAAAVAVADSYAAVAACGADLECVVNAQTASGDASRSYADAYKAVLAT